MFDTLLTRRNFLKLSGAATATVATSGLPNIGLPATTDNPNNPDLDNKLESDSEKLKKSIAETIHLSLSNPIPYDTSDFHLAVEQYKPLEGERIEGNTTYVQTQRSITKDWTSQQVNIREGDVYIGDNQQTDTGALRKIYQAPSTRQEVLSDFERILNIAPGDFTKPQNTSYIVPKSTLEPKEEEPQEREDNVDLADLLQILEELENGTSKEELNVFYRLSQTLPLSDNHQDGMFNIAYTPNKERNRLYDLNELNSLQVKESLDFASGDTITYEVDNHDDITNYDKFEGPTLSYKSKLTIPVQILDLIPDWDQFGIKEFSVYFDVTKNTQKSLEPRFGLTIAFNDSTKQDMEITQLIPARSSVLYQLLGILRNNTIFSDQFMHKNMDSNIYQAIILGNDPDYMTPDNNFQA